MAKEVEIQAAEINAAKLKALQATIDKIEKDYGKGTIMRLGDDISVNVEALSTGSLSLDLALGIGGIPFRYFGIGVGHKLNVPEALHLGDDLDTKGADIFNKFL